MTSRFASKTANKPKAMCVHVSEIKRVYETVAPDHFGVALDAVHANTTGIKPEVFASELKEIASTFT